MAQQRSVTYYTAGNDAVEQPALLTLAEPSSADKAAEPNGGRPVRSERARQLGLAGVAQARAALAAATQRAEAERAERALTRPAGKAA